MEDKRFTKMIQELKKMFPEQVDLNIPLAEFTTYKVGGPAKAVIRPADRDMLQQVVRMCFLEKVPLLVLGSGSNVLIHDDEIDLVVVLIRECCHELFNEGRMVFAGAGVLVKDLVAYCEKQNLAGLDFMSGIPGTVGGALRMNAGAFVGEIGDRVTKIEALSSDGKYLEIPASEAGFGYRRAVHLTGKILLGCWLKMRSGTQAELEKSRQDYLERRAAKQPLEYGSCGSVFKRPPENYAGSLIEKAGCKGMRVGGAKVSEKHANFIVNFQNSTARDIFRLIRKVQDEVYRQFQVWLEPEVKLVGFSDKEMEAVRRPNA